MKTIERFRSLAGGGFGGVEGVEALAEGVVRVLPQLPLGAMRAIDLLQRERAPGDFHLVTEGFRQWPGPNRGGVGVRAQVVVIDVEFGGLRQDRPPCRAMNG